ncbi:protein-L-isoaspartate(D-aspartate) O-methyltransferase [Methylococcus capsulatus]|uniref:protein-L-isoaspartate(D-aspartate) O-methyltransferase n=1 Tax=Methylococcus capsulatus TaxID=414 RepID=UPI001C52C4CD|nr:protein-L-isoaspartate(D-aspartate) O-methyltransferase [Methylococcus capsulatus]QXP88062.1 protein-L-isoaspartate(D-aspartate) O-methyltransferase [Methylococcus capsulatus]QXP94926.1 protein-L-isoaspartate(D-aspartate) O-methyltransferase [Methylococcus capsulatus]UQN13091.1 protein-L-isoaspartate(D-aspartate) O-methyltransferase [Methylococcus capsulatus]
MSLSQMMRDLEAEVSLTRHLTGRSALSPEVMEAMRKVPRHRFVPADRVQFAFDNGPVPIGCGQTISQPFIVALMTDLLNPEKESVVLEIGAGSGYQAAVLSRLVKRVYTVEIVPELGEQAAERLKELGYRNVEVRIGDGYFGWPEHAPYDGIIVTAAAPCFPDPLIGQLKPGGRMVIPVGPPYHHQELMTVDKDAEGNIQTCSVLPVAFVPLTGEGGYRPGPERA